MFDLGFRLVSIPGNTADPEVNGIHRDISEISAQRLVELAGRIFREQQKFGNIGERDLISSIVEGLRQGRIKRKSVTDFPHSFLFSARLNTDSILPNKLNRTKEATASVQCARLRNSKEPRRKVNQGSIWQTHGGRFDCRSTIRQRRSDRRAHREEDRPEVARRPHRK